jgi:hypothetical protein
MRPIVRSAAIAVCLAALFAFSAQARPPLRRVFVTQYPKASGTRLDACASCHAAGTALNPYGAAVKKASFKLLAIEKLDADGDGFSNRAEIDALTFPGDAKDRPAAKRGGKRDSTAADSGKARRGERDSSAAPPDSGAARDSVRR